jgi:hypothetical protein
MIASPLLLLDGKEIGLVSQGCACERGELRKQVPGWSNVATAHLFGCPVGSVLLSAWGPLSSPEQAGVIGDGSVPAIPIVC